MQRALLPRRTAGIITARSGEQAVKNMTHALGILVGIVMVGVMSVSGAPVTKTRDICIASPTGGGSFNTFIFRDVESLTPAGVIPLKGLFFTGARRVAPFHGSAAMASDGTTRVGLFVHSSADSTNDFTVSGVTDRNFVGTLKYDNDGDYVPNGTLAMQLVECSTIDIP
jgi:hypothetical protein